MRKNKHAAEFHIHSILILVRQCWEISPWNLLCHCIGVKSGVNPLADFSDLQQIYKEMSSENILNLPYDKKLFGDCVFTIPAVELGSVYTTSIET